MVSFIVDEQGNKTHAVVPIVEWTRIKSMTAEDSYISSFKNMADAFKGRVIPSVDYDIIKIVSELGTDKKIAKIIEIQYKYFESFSSKDIGLLYLMRTTNFSMFILLDLSLNNKETNEALSEFNKLYNIRNLQNKQLSIEEFQKLQQIFLLSIKQEDVIHNFKQSFQIGEVGFSKRVRKDAEIKRLFFYDFSNVFPLIFHEHIDEFGDMKEMMEGLAENIYVKNSKESAIAQMNKAIRDAKERIYKEEWKIYVGI